MKNCQDCIEQLGYYKNEADKLMKMFGDNYSLSNDKVQIVQASYANLKNKLKTEYKYYDCSYNEKNISDIEDAYYKPAIRDMYVYLKCKTNSRPGETMFHDLYNIWDYAVHWICKLEEKNK